MSKEIYFHHTQDIYLFIHMTTTITSLESAIDQLHSLVQNNIDENNENSNKDEKSIPKLFLPLDVQSNMTTLLEVLELVQNKKIIEVHVDLYENFKQRVNATEEVIQLFHALSQLYHLTSLWIDSGQDGNLFYTQPYYTLNVNILATTLQEASQLQRLGAYDIELCGNAQDFEELQNVVQNHTSLKAFGFCGCRLAEETILLLSTTTSSNAHELPDTSENTPASSEAAAADNEQDHNDHNDASLSEFPDHQEEDEEDVSEQYCFALNGLVENALATCTQIERVDLTGQELMALGNLTPQAVGSLCQSTTLTKLTLKEFTLHDQQMIAITNALVDRNSINASCLQELELTCTRLGRLGCTALAQLLFVNTTIDNVTIQLQELVFDDKNDNDHADHENDEDGDDTDIDNNNKDKKDNNNNNNNKQTKNKDEDLEGTDIDPTIPIAEALRHNQTLQYFVLYGPPPTRGSSISHMGPTLSLSPASQHAFVNMLRTTNFTLQQCDLPFDDDDLQQELDLFLKLNHAGRKHLLSPDGNATINEWVNVLRELRYDLDAVFYLIMTNPSLCAHAM